VFDLNQPAPPPPARPRAASRAKQPPAIVAEDGSLGPVPEPPPVTRSSIASKVGKTVTGGKRTASQTEGSLGPVPEPPPAAPTDKTGRAIRRGPSKATSEVFDLSNPPPLPATPVATKGTQKRTASQTEGSLGPVPEPPPAPTNKTARAIKKVPSRATSDVFDLSNPPPLPPTPAATKGTQKRTASQTEGSLGPLPEPPAPTNKVTRAIKKVPSRATSDVFDLNNPPPPLPPTPAAKSTANKRLSLSPAGLGPLPEPPAPTNKVTRAIKKVPSRATSDVFDLNNPPPPLPPTPAAKSTANKRLSLTPAELGPVPVPPTTSELG
jgi:hypothetical protein